MKNLKTLQNENLLKSKSYGWDKDKFWYLAKHPLNSELGLLLPKAEVHRYKYEHEKDCGEIFVSLALTGHLLLWEGEGRAVKGFRQDRKFALGEVDWYLENERSTQAPIVLRTKLDNYLKHYRQTRETFHVLFVVQDEAAVRQVIYLFEEYKLPNFYWATVFDEFVLGRSLLSGDIPDFELQRGEDGRAIDTQQIFSGGGTDYTPLFRALIVQRHNRALTDDEFLHLLKAHVDHGFALIKNDTTGFKSEDDYVDYLVELTRAGLEQRTQEAAPVIETTPAFGGLLRLQIGWENEQAVSVEFNRRTNNYLAVTGKPGSGKTQFVKDLLAQIRAQSDFAVNFIFFDYAKGDVADDAEFVEATRAEVVRLPDESLPVNPFARVNVNSETAVKVAAQEFADLMESVEKRLGIVQKRRLNDAILSGFEMMRGAPSPFPDFEIIRQEIDTQYFILNNWKPDTLTEVIRQLSDFKIFAGNDNAEIWNSLTNRTVVIDLHGLTVLREMTAFLVLNALYRELMAMPDSNVVDGVREMRTIIVIDEAHHFLKDKKRNVILENLIRAIRSKGASVFLMSQSPDDYDTGDFDFAELLEFIYLLQSSAGASKFLQNAFGVSAQEAKVLSGEVSNLPTATAIGKSYDENKKDKVNRLRVRQFWREKGLRLS